MQTSMHNIMNTALDKLFEKVDSFIPAAKQQPPRIGISANRNDAGQSCIAENYVKAVLQAGGAPVLIPVITDIQALTAIVEGLDGLLMTGGGDINPLFLAFPGRRAYPPIARRGFFPR